MTRAERIQLAATFAHYNAGTQRAIEENRLRPAREAKAEWDRRHRAKKRGT